MIILELILEKLVTLEDYLKPGGLNDRHCPNCLCGKEVTSSFRTCETLDEARELMAQLDDENFRREVVNFLTLLIIS